MSEEILKALARLFAIVTRQDGGVTKNEREFVHNFFRSELDQRSVQEYIRLYDGYAEAEQASEPMSDASGLVHDSIRTLAICKRINKTLAQKQKIVVLARLLELVSSDRNFTPLRMEIIHTVSSVFNVPENEYDMLEKFVTGENGQVLNFAEVLLICPQSYHSPEAQKTIRSQVTGYISFLHIRSQDVIFARYVGSEQHIFNGLPMQPRRVYILSPGSTVKTQLGEAHYYSDLSAAFNEELKTVKLSFHADIRNFTFPGGIVGLREVQLSEGPGKLIGIMGASGAGKTTLLNVLAGLEKPTEGNVQINGFNLHEKPEALRGVVGYVAQDDMLIEELTVYENLYYNARLCFDGFSEARLERMVLHVLQNLGLEQWRDLRVGSVLDKTISGGQRKRLNIALELIREPAVLFLDEPTSGLSSRDSENVIDLLKELSNRGKLVITVIHQPSSDIYKMFDKILIMDAGGFMAYYGPPVEAVTWFKEASSQADFNRGQCEVCGNVNPEQIFSLMEASILDEYGNPTNRRKVNPAQWNEIFKQNNKPQAVESVKTPPVSTLRLPGRLKQMLIFLMRDFRARISNIQYMLINLLEAPVLAAVLAFIIKYSNTAGDREYLFRYNDNIPAFFLISVIVALFMGLTVSAEEIIHDRRILKRESFLDLSRNSYLVSKLALLFSLSAVQTLLFVLAGNYILEIREMNMAFWLVLFSASCFANVLGLNISSAFNSAVTVYILIPLLLIPQMVLSGLLFSFDKMHDVVRAKGKVPVVADLMVSRWAYEAMAVHQFTSNRFQAPYYPYEKAKAEADFKSSWLVDELREKNRVALKEFNSGTITEVGKNALAVIKNSIRNEIPNAAEFGINTGTDLNLAGFNSEVSEKLNDYFSALESHYQGLYRKNDLLIQKKMAFMDSVYGENPKVMKDLYFNESLSELVRNLKARDVVLEHDGRISGQINPVYREPASDHFLDYRTPFFVPEKQFVGLVLPTVVFNVLVIWFMSLTLYITLYYRLLEKLIRYLSRGQLHA